MFDPDKNPSMPVKVGDRIQFAAISRDEFLQQGGEL
jgi:allophanate hydrolase subunit 1